MVIVLVLSLALTALRSGSAVWAGGLYLLTHALIALAVVGAVCRGPSERAWWLGFALFGWGYQRCMTWGLFESRMMPTTRLLRLLRPAEVPAATRGFVPQYDGLPESYFIVGQCLWSLVAAMIGGGLAHLLFASRPVDILTNRDPSVRPGDRPARPRWGRLAATGLAALLVVAILVWLLPRSDPALWAGAVYLLTWGILGTAALGFACRRGPDRMIWLGAALFGLGYMVMTRGPDPFESASYGRMVADHFLDTLRPWLPPIVSGFPADSAAVADANRRVWKALEQPVPMTFPNEAPLEDILNHVRSAIRSPDGREVAIYVDPVGLQEAEKTMTSPIQIEMEGIPLRTTLRLALKQLGLVYLVREGLVFITYQSSEDVDAVVDYYLLLGHCILALLAAALGAWLVPLVSGRRDEPAAVGRPQSGDGGTDPPGERKP
jgi:hypothetical protein